MYIKKLINKKKKEQIKIKVIKGDYIQGKKYNVQIWHSIDYGKTYYYAGYGKFCKDKKEVKAYIYAIYKTWYSEGYILSGRDFNYGKK